MSASRRMDHRSVQEPTIKQASPTGFQRAAKRLSGWAANLLASGLILVAGVALGRQVLEWWRADSRGTPLATSDLAATQVDVGNPDRPQLLELGDLPFALHREELSGDQPTAFAALLARAKLGVAKPVEPAAQAGPAERSMLARLGAHQPVAHLPGRWEIYQLEGPYLLVPGIQFFPGANQAAPLRRVVFWGLAVPSGHDYSKNETRWTLFSYQASGAASRPETEEPRIALPAGARMTLSLAAEDGSRLINFRGPGDSLSWSREFERLLAAGGWRTTEAWRQEGAAWQGKFSREKKIIDVRWIREDSELVGLITITPKM